MSLKIINIEYYALMREEAGRDGESIETNLSSAAEVFSELNEKHNFSLNMDMIRVAINNEFCDWNQLLNNQDTLIFVPPVAGG